MKTNAERIRTYRDQNNMSLRTMALKLAVSEAFLSDLESGAREVSKTFAEKAGLELELDLHIHQWKCEQCGETR